MLRPHRMDEIANTIIDVMIQHQDPNIVFNIKDNPACVAEIKSLLE
jgi:hypothetical protein